jgi:predicted dehydrogenase
MSNQQITRRTFLATAASSFAFTYIPKSVWGANERFYLAGIGVGGKGAGEVKDLTKAGATFVALCDVDGTKAGSTFKSFPNAKRYTDFRIMLENEKGIDAVTVSTPDHTHALPSLMAMSMGKHVYCQKPLTHSIYEARLMTNAAKYYKVQTQMGNQAHAGEPIRRGVELVRAGIIGPVREVHAWTNRPIWPQGQKAIEERKRLAAQPKPADLDWDLWLGPAPMRKYNACYVPFKWRGWWDFGTGALGDMACHIMDMPYWALDLGSPVSVEAESAGQTTESGPDWSTITYMFDQRSSVGGGKFGGAVGPEAAVKQPEVKFVWYDGTKDGKQNAPYKLLQQATEEARKNDTSRQAPNTGRNRKRKPPTISDPTRWDMVLVGDKGLMAFKRSATDWIVTPSGRLKQFANTPKTIRRVPNEDVEWLQAIKGGPKPLSSFDYSGQLTEMVLLGNLAVRLDKKMMWNAKTLRVTNAPEADELIRRQYRKGWDISLPTAISKLT